MAKHLVKCSICGKVFDANVEPYVKTCKDRRYAHKECAEQQELKKSQEEKDKESLEQYIIKLLKIDYIDARIRKQINTYVQEYNYTFSGIQKALTYFYEIKKNPIEKANGGIGIVPYIYQESFNYYYSLWEAQQRNEVKEIEQYKPQIVEITINRPLRPIKQKKRFIFLDEEGD